ncbi:MAG: orotidine-5'-phosphate decarboxylase [bacterium]
MNLIKANERLIVALDVSTSEEAKIIVEKLGDAVSFYKIGIILQMGAGLELVDWLIKRNKKVFLDLKYCDVEDTIREAVKRVAETGAAFLTVHGNGKIIEAAVEGRGKSPLKIFTVTVLTSFDAFDIKDMGFPCSVSDLVIYRAKKTIEAGGDGVISSALEAKSIRKAAGDKLLIITPGIRPEGANVDDHKRCATPAQAIKNGADYLVVGRPIIKAENPREVAEKIIEEIETTIQIF